MEPKLLLIVKVPAGVHILDTPRPQTSGANIRRSEPVGKPLRAYLTVKVAGVEYAWLVPQNPLRDEWVRVAEADHSIEYVEVIKLEDSTDDLKTALREMAAANTLLAAALSELAKKK